MFTTLAAIRADRPHPSRYRHLCKKLGGLKAYGKDTPLPYSKVLDICGLEDCLWILGSVDDKTEWILKLASFGFAERLFCYEPVHELQEYLRTLHLYIHGEETHEAMFQKLKLAYNAIELGASQEALFAAANCDSWETSWLVWEVADVPNDDDICHGNLEVAAQTGILRALLLQAEGEDSGIVFGEGLAATSVNGL